MSERQTLVDHAQDAESLSAFLDLTVTDDVDLGRLADVLANHVWERDVPRDRAIEILRSELDRVAEYEAVSVSASARAPRYVDINDLDLVSGYEFEHVLAEILSQIDGETTVTGAAGDQGLDVVWNKTNATVGIQAKAYDIDNPVGNSAVQEIYTGADVRGTEYDIDVPAVVTTSRFTDGAREAAKRTGVELYGRDTVQEWLAEAQLDAESLGRVLDEVE